MAIKEEVANLKMAIREENAKKIREFCAEDRLHAQVGRASRSLSAEIEMATEALHQPRHIAPIELDDKRVSLSPAYATGSLDAYAKEIEVRLSIFTQAAEELEFAVAYAMAEQELINEAHDLSESEEIERLFTTPCSCPRCEDETDDES